MGLFDVLRGKRSLKQPQPTDRLFAMSTAAVTMELSMGMTSTGKAAIVFQPLDTADFTQIVGEMVEVLGGMGEENDTKISTSDDDFGYRWMVLEDPEAEDLVVGINTVTNALQDGGYGERILCAVFAMQGERPRKTYWIYNYKRGAFYPFVPSGPNARNSEAELRLKAQIGNELPIEAEMDRWFPLWGIPI